MPKPSLNDYSGLGSVFSDGLLGALLSTGVFATLLPNLVETFGQVINLGSFKALNVFSVIYFLGPILVCTGYWVIVGHIQYLYNRVLPGNDTGRISNIHPAENNEKANKTRKLVFIIFIGKIVIILLYLLAVVADVNVVHATTSLLMLGIVYPIVFYRLQLNIVKRQADDIFDQVKSNPDSGLTDTHLKRLGQAHLRLTAWVLIPDLFTGLALVVFSHPWIIYHNGFFIILNAVACLITGVVMMPVVKDLPDEKLKRQYTFFFIVILFLAMLFPSVNMNGSTTVVPAMVAATFIFHFVNRQKPLTYKIGWTHVFSFAVLFLMVCFVFYPIYERSNRAYLQKRFDASQQLSDTQLFPFVNDQVFLTDLDPTAVLPELSAIHIHQKNMENAFFPDKKWEYLAKDNNVRKFYYYNYQSIAEELEAKGIDLETLVEERLYHQHAIDSFYAGVSDHLSNRTFKILESDRIRREQEKRPRLKDYNHPLDYYASFFAIQKEQLDQADLLAEKSASIYRHLMLLNRAARTGGDDLLLKNFLGEINKLNSDIKTLHGEIPELKNKQADNDHDSVSLKQQLSFHLAFLGHKKELYSDYFERAQKIYRSYLVDSQRLGIYLLCSTLLIVIGIIYLDVHDRKYFCVNGAPKPEEDGHSHSVWYALGFGIFILILPLLRPIEPEMINPENPYWMISLEQWHAPTFARATLDEERTRYNEPLSLTVNVRGEKTGVPGDHSTTFNSYEGDVTVEEPSVTTSDTAVRNAIQKVKLQLEENRKSTEAINHTMTQIHKTMASDGMQPR